MIEARRSASSHRARRLTPAAPELDLPTALDLVRSDPALAQSLLRYVNSGVFRWVAPIEGPHRALVTLGRAELRRWAAISSLHAFARTDRPRDLILRAAARGSLCEQIAPALGLGDRSSELFFLGLFLLVEELVGRSSARVLAQVPLPVDVRAALLHQPSALAPLLRLVTACDLAHFDVIEELAARSRLDLGRLGHEHRSALARADQLTATA